MDEGTGLRAASAPVSSETPDELMILACTRSGSKLMEEIISQTGVSPERCRDKVSKLVDAGLLVIEHDSDYYGHELVKFRHPFKKFSIPEQIVE